MRHIHQGLCIPLSHHLLYIRRLISHIGTISSEPSIIKIVKIKSEPSNACFDGSKGCLTSLSHRTTCPPDHEQSPFFDVNLEKNAFPTVLSLSLSLVRRTKHEPRKNRFPKLYSRIHLVRRTRYIPAEQKKNTIHSHQKKQKKESAAGKLSTVVLSFS